MQTGGDGLPTRAHPAAPGRTKTKLTLFVDHVFVALKQAIDEGVLSAHKLENVCNFAHAYFQRHYNEEANEKRRLELVKQYCKLSVILLFLILCFTGSEEAERFHVYMDAYVKHVDQISKNTVHHSALMSVHELWNLRSVICQLFASRFLYAWTTLQKTGAAAPFNHDDYVTIVRDARRFRCNYHADENNSILHEIERKANAWVQGKCSNIPTIAE